MEMMERIGEERIINALDKKRKRKWIGRTMEGDSLLTKENERKTDKSKTKTDDAVLDADGCIWKAISEESGDFGQMILSRKNRTEEESTK